MRSHRYADQLAGTRRELVGERVRYAGMDASLLTGGAGFRNANPVAPPNANGILAGASDNAHFGVIGMVILAVVILFVLDKAGFRFAVTAGKR